MTDPFARIRVLGAEVACHLRPGSDCDVAALTRDLNEACEGCGSIEEVRPRVTSVADGHALDVEYNTSPPVTSDPIERLVSIWFSPR